MSAYGLYPYGVGGYGCGIAETGAGITVAPGVGHVAISGKSLTISQPRSAAPGAGHAILLGRLPGIAQAHTVEPGAGHGYAGGYAPIIGSANQVAPGTGRLVVLGHPHGILQQITVAPGAARAAMLGYAPSISQAAAPFTQAQLDYLLAYMEANLMIPTAEQNANAVWANATGAMLAKLSRNKMITDPSTGTLTIYADDGVTPLLTGSLYEDAAGTQPYRGKGAERRERLT